MTPEIKEKWLEALRSGKYAQTRGRLQSRLYPEMSPTSIRSFCCLGVLCEITHPDNWDGVTWHFQGSGHTKDLPELFRVSIDLPYGEQARLIRMNDDEEASFAQIADWIEANL